MLVELGRLGNPETRLILGIIVIEDLFLALYLAALAPVLGQADGLAESLLLFGRSFAFLAVLGLVARFGGPVVEKLIRSRDDELLTISFFGFAVLLAGLAEVIGVSDAIGAFMAGLDPGRHRPGPADRAARHPDPRCLRRRVLLHLRPPDPTR